MKVGTSTAVDDSNSLAAHLINDHKLFTKEDFNKVYRFYILRNVNQTKLLTIEEQRFVNYFDTLRPKGLNCSNPIGLGKNYSK